MFICFALSIVNIKYGNLIILYSKFFQILYPTVYIYTFVRDKKISILVGNKFFIKLQKKH